MPIIYNDGIILSIAIALATSNTRNFSICIIDYYRIIIRCPSRCRSAINIVVVEVLGAKVRVLFIKLCSRRTNSYRPMTGITVRPTAYVRIPYMSRLQWLIIITIINLDAAAGRADYLR